MSGPSDDLDVTNLLLDWRRGDETALARLVPIVYQELRRVARARLRPSATTTRSRRRRWCTKPTCAWWIWIA